jgi:hypothetical protein
MPQKISITAAFWQFDMRNRSRQEVHCSLTIPPYSQRRRSADRKTEHGWCVVTPVVRFERNAEFSEPTAELILGSESRSGEGSTTLGDWQNRSF